MLPSTTQAAASSAADTTKEKGIESMIHNLAAAFMAQHPDGRFVTPQEGNYWGLAEAACINAIMKAHPSQPRSYITHKFTR